MHSVHATLRSIAAALSARPYLVLVPLTLVVAFFQATAHALESVDEGLYAEMAKEMAEGGDWLTMHWTGEPWFGKPPLFMWLVAATYRVFGVSELTSRLVPGLCGASLIALTFAIAQRVSGEAAAWIAAALLLTSHAFLKQAVFCTTDVVLATLFLAAVWIHLKWGTRGFWAVSCCFALAYMDKSAAALVTFLGLAPLLFMELRREPERFWPRLLSGAALVAVIVLPWHVLMYVRYGSGFLEQNLGYHVLQRVTENVENNARGPGYYFWALRYYFGSRYEWLLLLPLLTAWRWSKEDLRKLAPVALPALAMLAALTPMKTKLFWYVYPAIAPFAILAGHAIGQALAGGNVLAMVAFSAFAIAGTLGPGWLALAGIVALLGVMADYRFRPAPARAAACVFAGVLFAVASIRTVRTIASRQPERADVIASLARHARVQDPADRDPAFVVEGRMGMAWVFYTGRSWCAAYDVPGVSSGYPHALVEQCLTKHPVLHMILPEPMLAVAMAHPGAELVAQEQGLAYLRLRNKTNAPRP